MVLNDFQDEWLNSIGREAGQKEVGRVCAVVQGGVSHSVEGKVRNGELNSMSVIKREPCDVILAAFGGKVRQGVCSPGQFSYYINIYIS